MLGLIGVIITFISTQSGLIVGRLIACIIAVGVLALWLNSGRYVARLSKRISVIEERINGLPGEKLLEWESQGGDRLIRKLFSG
jgi:hypothetical protein